MAARFAGSQRVGDRRRRRLAVEADEGAPPETSRQDLPARGGKRLSIDQAHTEPGESTQQPEVTFPVAQLVPLERWKYAVVAAVSVLINGGLLVASWLAPRLATVVGPAAERILEPVSGPAVKWYSSLLLLLSAQFAILIWWARSRSLKDFEGRYWLWNRAALIWLAFSACLTLDAGQTAVDLIRHFRPSLAPAAAVLAWLLPASLIGFSTARGLYREMSGCRASRILFLMAIGCYAAAAGFDLELLASLRSRAQALLVQASLLTGHVTLFFSMWIHARHVIHCSVEPEPTQERTWRIPRPHFRWLRLSYFRRRQRPVVAEQPVSLPPLTVPAPKGRRRRKSDATAANNNDPAGEVSGDQAEPRNGEPVELEDIAGAGDSAE
jgi:hypothetical protein